MARVRQFGALRQSRFQTVSKKSVSHSSLRSGRLRASQSSYLCVQCANKSLSQLKKEKTHNSLQKEIVYEAELRKSRTSWEEQQVKFRRKNIEEKRKMVTQFNEGVVRERREMKLKQEKEKEKELSLSKQMEQRQKEQTIAEMKREKLLKEKWMGDLRKQMLAHQQQKKKERMKKESDQGDKSILQPRNIFNSAQRYQAYIKQLKEQIIEKEAKKSKERHQQKKELDIKAIPLLDQVEKRERLAFQFQQQRKQILLKEARNRENQLQQEKRERSEQNQLERGELEKEIKKEEQLREANRQKKSRKRQQYLNCLKEQIQVKVKELKKMEEEAKSPSKTYWLQGEKREVTSHCTRCQKEVPKLSLTSFKSPFLKSS